jgi:hypothetical protein
MAGRFEDKLLVFYVRVFQRACCSPAHHIFLAIVTQNIPITCICNRVTVVAQTCRKATFTSVCY